MKERRPEDLSSLSMLELFRAEAEAQTAVLIEGLLELERSEAPEQNLELLMRAAHSLKGAARIVHLETGVRIAHAMEDCLVAAQRGPGRLGKAQVDALLRGTDFLVQLSKQTEGELSSWEESHAAEVLELAAQLGPGVDGPAAAAPAEPSVPVAPLEVQPVPENRRQSPERVLRLNAENLNRLLGLAGESLVESRRWRPFSDSLQRLRRLQGEIAGSLELLQNELDGAASPERMRAQLAVLGEKAATCQQYLAERIEEIESFDRRSGQLSQRLYLEVLRTRMRPFSEGVRRLPRMVRDLARALGKQVRLEILGEATQVDRDILERLETPLAHLLRNAVDHGCEMPEERVKAGKAPEATIQVEARHRAGSLTVTVCDDGAGIETDRLRQAIVQRNLATPAAAAELSEQDLIDFLFLPGFSLAERVTDISGRGVGLDIVQSMVKSVHGRIRVSQERGRGARFLLQLPLTLSVMRALLVEVANEPYGFPLGRIERALKLTREDIRSLEGRNYFTLRDEQIGLITAHDVLECGEPKPAAEPIPVIVIGEPGSRYGLMVDRFMGERELVVQPLDSRLGRVRDIQAAALMEDGAPVLIVDVEDLTHSIDEMVSGSNGVPALHPIPIFAAPQPKRRRILAVDDSLTARELVRKILNAGGYEADLAVDGLDAWNCIRKGRYDLVITDVEMPRMDGIELARFIKKDPGLQWLPVLIVSHRDRADDRWRGLDAGADYYLTKGSFDEDALLRAVRDLIGEESP